MSTKAERFEHFRMAVLESGLPPERVSPGELGFIAIFDARSEAEMRLCYMAARLSDPDVPPEAHMPYEEWFAKCLVDNPDWNPEWLSMTSP